MQKIKKKRGSILAFAVILMSFMMVIALAITFSSLRSRKGVNISSNSTTAFQKTDQGMEMFLYELFKNSKPFDTLEQLAKNMSRDGESFKCSIAPDGEKDVAVISGNDFKMVAFKQSKPDLAGGEEEGIDLIEVNNCDIEIARIYKVRVSGNFGGAVRSLEVNLSNVMQRSKVGFWNFEDNARTVRLNWGKMGEESAGASEVLDGTKDGEYTLTLCPIEDSRDGKSRYPLPGTKPSKNCPYLSAIDGAEATEKVFYMSHLPKWFSDEYIAKPDDEGKCYWETVFGDKYEVACGSYVNGVVKEDVGLGTADSSKVDSDPITDFNLKPGSKDYYAKPKAGSEALEFNGISHFLAPNLEEPANNFVKEESRKFLNLDESEGMSIVLWVNNNSETGDEKKEILVSKSESDSEGYELSLEGDDICFRVGSQKTCTGLEKDSWHHIVARYDGSGKGGTNGILIDGKFSGSSLSSNGTISDGEDVPLFIGGKYEGDSDKFNIEDFEGAFGGMIDNVEIYNRYLIDFEAQVLCQKASGDDWVLEETGSCEKISW